MNRWQYRPTPFKYQLSDLTLFSVSLTIQVREEKLLDDTPPVAQPSPPYAELMENSQGFLIRGMPVVATLPAISRIDDYLCYVPLQYQHCYIDLSMSFADYQKKFSAKTRSTINRKVKKYAEHCGGSITWKAYASPEQMQDFFHHARTVSKLTYQERLLDAGLPDTEPFRLEATALAAEQHVRAYILFDGERPVSYLYCPIQDGVLIYAYLGYDPDYMKLSVGTVLQWLALEQLLNEACFRYFDFTEGQSAHKSLFATHQRQCANVFLLKNSAKNISVIYSHHAMNGLSNWLGVTLERHGLKAKIKHFLRFTR